MTTKKTTSTKKRPSKKYDPGKGGGGGGGGYGGDDEPMGESPENIDIHEDYLNYRLEGGEAPSSKTYARAVEQFQRLPGAIRGKPPFVPPDISGDSGDTNNGNEDRKSGKGDKP